MRNSLKITLDFSAFVHKPKNKWINNAIEKKIIQYDSYVVLNTEENSGISLTNLHTFFGIKWLIIRGQLGHIPPMNISKRGSET